MPDTLATTVRTSLIFLAICMKQTETIDCGYGSYPCADAEHCVAQRMNCDSKVDCPDGSDELNCTDAVNSFYYDHLFPKRPTADLDDQEKECDFISFKSQCQCWGTDILCENMELTEIPNNLPSDGVSTLVLSGNNFPVLDATTMSAVPNLDTLVMKHAQVEVLRSGAFSGQPLLHRLFLDNNCLTQLPEPIFVGGNELVSLVFSYNLLEDIPDGAFQNLQYLQTLDLRQNLLVHIRRFTLEPLTNLRILYLSENHLKVLDAGMFPLLPVLTTLSLAHNEIVYIEPGVFLPLPSLQDLYLSGNHVSKLKNDTFQNLSALHGLTLDHNKLKEIEIGAFNGLHHLKSLDLRKNLLQMLDHQLFSKLVKLQYMYLDDFHLCAAALHVRVCEPHGDGISSLDHLLDNVLLRCSVWLMAFLACCGNLLVLLGRTLMREPNAVHSLYIMNLALSDLLMGCYLFFIAIADWHYRGRYVTVEYEWRHSSTCSFCGFLSTLSSESSVLILSLITWDRLVSVVQPLHHHRQSVRQGAINTIVLWILAIITAVVPLSGAEYFGSEYYGNNGVCLPLHIHNPYAKGWEYSALVFVLGNALGLGFICCAYWHMLQVIRSSGVSLRSTQERQDRAIAQRFALIVLTDCACWIPVIVIKVLALSGVSIHQDLYAWLAIFVLPVNSALNPVLYTLTTKLFKQQFSHLLCKWKQCGKPLHSKLDSAFSLSNVPNTSSRKYILYHGATGSTILHSCSSWKSNQGAEGTPL